MAQESVAAVAGELDFMAGFWREGGECCRPQGSVGPASGPDATGARPDLGARDKTESSLPSMLTGAFTTGARSIVCPGRSAVRCALQVSACFCSLQAAIDAKRRAHKHATTQGVPSRCFPDPDKVVSHRRGPTSWDVFRVASLFPSFLCLTNPRCVQMYLCGQTTAGLDGLFRLFTHATQSLRHLFDGCETMSQSLSSSDRSRSIPFFCFAWDTAGKLGLLPNPTTTTSLTSSAGPAQHTWCVGTNV
jgi:hypothetical protein